MIKVAGFLKRAPNVTHEQLVEHWEHMHAPRVAKSARPERYAVTFFDGADGGFDGMASMWMRDLEHFQQAFSPEQVKETNADGFTDLIEVSAALTLFTEEHVLLDKGVGATKFVFLARRRTGVERAEYQHYWVETHGQLVAGALEKTAARRYAISLTTGPEGAAYDGLAELAFPSLGDLEQGLAEAAVQDNFGSMTDMESSLRLIGREVVYM